MAFENINTLEDVHLNNEITSIGYRAFRGGSSSGDKNIIKMEGLPEKLTYIGTNAF
jgi:hypothetical protein